MFTLFKQERPATGIVRFRGNIHPRWEEFVPAMTKAGVRYKAADPGSKAHWHLRLGHDQWGKAEVYAARNAPPFPKEMIELAWRLTDEEKREARAGGVELIMAVEASAKHVLRDRKRLLRYMGLFMGGEGVLAYDTASGTCWSRGGLDEELAHDADLDIDAIFSIHAVVESGPQGPGDKSVQREPDSDQTPYWVHTHGLAELGAFDFDILAPSPSIWDSMGDLSRVIAFGIVEGAWKQGERALLSEGVEVLCAPVEEFHAKAGKADRALRENDENHNRDRVVLCDPPKKGLGSILGNSGALRPSTVLRSFEGEELPLPFSSGASELMAQRARRTVGVFERWFQKFSPLGLPALIKAGYETDAGGTEHLWFKVERVEGSAIRATLVNKPWDIPRMYEGQECSVPFERLSDWTIMTPAGSITPRSMKAARFIEANFGRFQKMMAEMRAAGAEG
jgi:hypothetical protein